MSKIALSGNASGTGTLTIAAPNTSTDRTLTLPDATGTVQVSGQPVSATTGTFSGTISGGSTIGVGGATPAASGAGITFPATQNASSDANTLDDYEEGTWTPSVGGNTTYSVQQGQYVKVGRLVYIQGKIVITTLGTGSSTNITNLPFVATYAAGSINGNGGVTYFSSLAVNALALTCFNSANTTVMGFNACTTSGTGISGYNAAVFGANTRIDFSICYEADA